MAYTWVIGVVLIILGSLGNNLGNNLVCLGHKQNRIHDESEAKSQHKKEHPEQHEEPGIVAAVAAAAGVAERMENGESEEEEGGGEGQLAGEAAAGTSSKQPVNESAATVTTSHKGKPPRTGWWSWRSIGVFIFVAGNLLTFASFGFAAQSLLASLESIQFVSNVAFGKFVHKETITARMLIATALIVVGNILVVIFAEHKAVLYDSEMLIALYRTNTAYHAYLAIAITIFILMHITYKVYHHSRMKHRKLLWHHGFIEPFAFSVSAAIMGTQAVLNSKCMSMLIQVSVVGEVNEFERPTIYVILVTWIIFVSYWLRRLDKGLELFPPLFIIPVLQVFFVFFAILCGGIYFEEFTGFDALETVGFVIGVLMILSGVYGLAPTNQMLEIPPDPNEGKEVEEKIVVLYAKDEELDSHAFLEPRDKPPNSYTIATKPSETELSRKQNRLVVKHPSAPQAVDYEKVALLNDLPAAAVPATAAAPITSPAKKRSPSERTATNVEEGEELKNGQAGESDESGGPGNHSSQPSVGVNPQ